MQIELTNKFLNFKHRSLLSYADILSQNYFNQSTKLWETPQELYKLLDNLIQIYVSKFYIQDTQKKNKKDIEMSYALNTLKEYYQSSFEDKKSQDQKTIYILMNILYIINRIDKEITYFKQDSTLTENIIAKLRNLLKDEYIDLNLNENHFIINLLANKIKDNERIEKKFFDQILSKEIYIDYQKLKDNTYLIESDYNIPSLGSFNNIIIDNVYEQFGINNKIKELSLLLLYVSLLKMYSNDIQIPEIVMHIPRSFIESEKEFAGLMKIAQLDMISNHLTLMLNLSDYKKYNQDLKSIINKPVAILIDEYNNDFINKEDVIYIKDTETKVIKELTEKDYKMNILTETERITLDQLIEENIEEEK